jgi:uncharacterized membrane protein
MYLTQILASRKALLLLAIALVLAMAGTLLAVRTGSPAAHHVLGFYYRGAQPRFYYRG